MKVKGLSHVVFLRATIVACILLMSGVIAVNAASSKNPSPVSRKEMPSGNTIPQSLPLLVDVGADRCVPCKLMAPILEELRKEYGGVLEVEFVDAWKNPEEARKYRVKGIPTQIFYDGAQKELGRHMGYASKEDILREFEQLGVPLKKPTEK
jgi:thioredoxin 1